jgi:hypothetical protein
VKGRGLKVRDHSPSLALRVRLSQNGREGKEERKLVFMGVGQVLAKITLNQTRDRSLERVA